MIIAQDPRTGLQAEFHIQECELLWTEYLVKYMWAENNKYMYTSHFIVYEQMQQVHHRILCSFFFSSYKER
jgi:hypothetical protein